MAVVTLGIDQYLQKFHVHKNVDNELGRRAT